MKFNWFRRLIFNFFFIFLPVFCCYGLDVISGYVGESNFRAIALFIVFV